MADVSAVGIRPARQAVALVTFINGDGGFSRISKAIIDRKQASLEAVLARRKAFSVTLCCGDDVASSRTLQVAVLTAASIAVRCFPGAVRAKLSDKLAAAPLLLWPSLHLTLGQTLDEILGAGVHAGVGEAQTPHALVFGGAPEPKGALRVTFDGWIAKAGPAHEVRRMSERQYFAAAGVLAASLGVSELFLSFADIDIAAARRVVSFSLWRPDLDISDADALGIPVEFLPRSLWLLGLGHLGNAYLWALATLPYPDPKEVEFALLDFDNVEHDNIETGIIFDKASVGRFKTRACDAWLARRQFRTRLVERRFDATFQVHDAQPRLEDREPVLALCGFDSNAARRDLPGARFKRVIEAGLGGMATNFDTISLHTLPHPRAPHDLWPDLSKEEQAKRAAQLERMARENPGYTALGGDDCGRRELAGKSVAVPFVGATAASFVVAEAVRLLHDGPSYLDLRLNLGDPGKLCARRNGNYTPPDTTGLTFVPAALEPAS